MPYNNYGSMQGGMFGPMSGPQNIGGAIGGIGGGLGQNIGGGRGIGGAQVSDREMQAIIQQMLMQSQSPTGGALPVYDNPAPAGGPPAPQGVPGIGTSGVDPSMIGGGAGGGLQGMDFGAQDIASGTRGTQEGLMNLAMQQAEAKRLEKMLADMEMAALNKNPNLMIPSGMGGTQQPIPGFDRFV